MSVIQAIVLGLIQGLTEFLPISSSGHLIFVPVLFGWSDQGQAFDVIVHLGTLCAVIIFFRKKLSQIVKSFLSSEGDAKERRFGWLLILSIIPALIGGFLMDIVFDIEIRSTVVVGVNLIVWGAILWLADRYSRTNGTRDLESLTKKDALIIGLAQLIALIPGTSRSGITMTTGLFSGFTKKDAAEFSFLMSVPIIAIAGASKLLGIVGSGIDAAALPLVIGFATSAVSGFLAIWGTMGIIKRWSFTPFVVYRILLGILILIYFT